LVQPAADGGFIVHAPVLPEGRGDGLRFGIAGDAYEGAVALATRALLDDHVIVIDTEHKGDRVVEVGMVRMSYGHIEAVESFLVHPGEGAIPPGAGTKKKQGMAQLVDGAPPFASVAGHMANFVAGHELFVGWYLAKDRDLLLDEFHTAGIGHGKTAWMDLKLWWNALHARRGSAPHLDGAYSDVFNASDVPFHTALGDAIATAQLLQVLSLEMLAQGMRPEDLVTEKGRHGTVWHTGPVETALVRRGGQPLPHIHRRLSRRQDEDLDAFLRMHGVPDDAPGRSTYFDRQGLYEMGREQAVAPDGREMFCLPWSGKPDVKESRWGSRCGGVGTRRPQSVHFSKVPLPSGAENWVQSTTDGFRPAATGPRPAWETA